jgi:hypothetical protein
MALWQRMVTPPIPSPLADLAEADQRFTPFDPLDGIVL